MTAKHKKIRLLAKTSRNYLISGLLLMFVSLIALYFMSQYFIREETDDGLKSTLYRIEKKLEAGDEINSFEPLIEIRETIGPEIYRLKDTLMVDPLENEEELFRQLSSTKNIKGKKYTIYVRTLLVESEDILLAILGSYLSITLLLFLAQYYLSRAHARKVWKPFFENLDKLKTFSLKSNKEINFVATDVLEFSELNDELVALTNKVLIDYKNLKQFTEDVSHEIQTPLSIIQAKIGNLIDGNEISQAQFQLLTELQQNVQRLANLNKKLVLLAKIDNHRFTTTVLTDLGACVAQSVENFSELSNIPIHSKTPINLQYTIDRTLAQIMIDNLLSNAVKYTTEGGHITISSTNNSITIANTGATKISKHEKLYDRFYRENPTQRSLGLGLAIVKKICDVYGLQIGYLFKNKAHHFTITFPIQ